MLKKTWANIAVLLANVLYGINYLAVKEVVPHYMHPYALSVFRASGALFLLWFSAFFIKSMPVDKRDYWKLAVAGLLGVAINQTLLIAGLNYTTSINASIIMTSNPLIVMVMSAVVLRNPITPKKVLGIALGATGAGLLIANSGKISVSGNTALGDVLILVNAIMYAVYLTWVKPLMAKYDAFTVMRWMFLFGSLFVFVWGGPEFFATSFDNVSPFAWSATAFVVIGATFFTYLLNVFGLKYVNPSTVSIYINIQPVVASLLAVLLAKDALSAVKVVSLVFVVLGVYLVNGSNK